MRMQSCNLFNAAPFFPVVVKGRDFSPAIILRSKEALASEVFVRAHREQFRKSGRTYFVSFQTADRLPLFRHENWSVLLVRMIECHRAEFQLHDFVVMPDHIHLLITPNGAVERAVQLIKGGFSFAAKREFGWNGRLWQAGFSDHRIRDVRDYQEHVRYVRKNVESLKSVEHKFCGANAGLALDAVPQWLKPLVQERLDGGAEAPPLHKGDKVQEGE